MEVKNTLSEDYLRGYWNQYIIFEKEFATTAKYVSVCDENKNTFSNVYQKLLIELGSEVEVVLKEYCMALGGLSKKNMLGYSICIMSNCPEFATQKVKYKNTGATFMPWENWGIVDDKGRRETPFWWTAYNKVKHDRLGCGEIDGTTQEYYKFANQGYVLNALAGLYQVLIYRYFDIATAAGNRIRTPLPGSRLFSLVDNKWDDVEFYYDFALYIDDDTGNLMMQTEEPY